MAFSGRVRWAGVLTGGVLLVGVGVVFVVVGLDKADKIASSAGFFVGVAGLAIAAYGVILARRTTPPPPPPEPPPASGQATASGDRSVAIGGDSSGPIVTGDNNEVQ